MSLVVSSFALVGAGLTSSLSPCVLPLVPGYIGALSDADWQKATDSVKSMILRGIGAL